MCRRLKAAVQCPRWDRNTPMGSWRKASPRGSCSTTSTSAGELWCSWSCLQGTIKTTGLYLSWTSFLPNRKEPKANPSSDGKKDAISGLGSVSALDEDNVYAKVYHKDGTEVDLTKNSLPSGGKYEKVNNFLSNTAKKDQIRSSIHCMDVSRKKKC